MGKTARFVPRSSHFDIHTPNSNVHRSGYNGWLNLFGILGFFFVFVENFHHFSSTGSLVGLQSLIDIFDTTDIFYVLPLLILSSFLTVSLHKFILRFQCSITAARLLHAIFLIIFFSVANIVLIQFQWPIIPCGSYLIELLILVFKSHSYLSVNRSIHYDPKSIYQKPPAGSEPMKYPDNVSYGNFLFFLAAPTLIYEITYPRNKGIRIIYVLEKMFTFAAVVSFMHVIAERFVVPVLNSTELSALTAVLDLIIPFLLCDLLMFYVLFEVICNGFAELTRFADRNFYDDWWNSTTFDEYARKWNRPVHEWLKRHVYRHTIRNFNASPTHAAFVTFFFSSILHEYFLGMLFGLFRPWIFILQMLQVPLIHLGGSLRGTRMGNIAFWVGLCLGIPLMATLYSREHYIRLQNEGMKNSIDMSTVEAFLLLVVPSLVVLLLLFLIFRCFRGNNGSEVSSNKEE